MTEKFVPMPQFRSDREAIEFYLPQNVQIFLSLDRNAHDPALNEKTHHLAETIRDSFVEHFFTEGDQAHLRNYNTWVANHPYEGGRSNGIQRSTENPTSQPNGDAKSGTA